MADYNTSKFICIFCLLLWTFYVNTICLTPNSIYFCAEVSLTFHSFILLLWNFVFRFQYIIHCLFVGVRCSSVVEHPLKV